MAKVFFGPYAAIKYVGAKSKELAVSVARPKPKLKKGDIVILDKRSAFNLTKKGFGEFEEVKDISFVKADTETVKKISELEALVLELQEANAKLVEENESLKPTEDKTDEQDTTKDMQEESIPQVDSQEDGK